MKKILLFVLAVAAALALLPSCEKETVLTVNPSSLSFPDAGGSQTVTLTANKAWSASSTQSWCKVSPSAGEEAAGSRITIACDANTTYDERSCAVTFTCAEKTVTVNVTQATNQGLVVGQTSFELTKAAQQLEIPVQANVKFSVEVAANCKDWIKYSTTKGLTSSTVVLDIAENKDYDSREGQVTIKQEGGSLSSTVSIKQTQLDGLFISTPEYHLSNESHTLTVEVSTNVAFEVTSGADWVKYVETKGLNTKQVILDISANETYDARETQVTVKQKNGSLSGVVTIRQDEKYGLMVTQPDFELGPESQTIDVEVKFNVDFDVVVPESCKDWIRLVSTKDLNQKTYTFSIAANDSFGAREGSLTFKQKEGPLSGTVSVKQAQNDALIVDQTVFEVSGDGGEVTVDVSANIDYTIESQQDWIQVIQTKGLQDHQFILEIAANEFPDPREGTVSIRQKDGKLSQNILVKQGKSILLQEREALMAFYEIMNGKDWSRSDNWGSDKPFKEWYGVHTYNEYAEEYDPNGHVHSIFLPGIGAHGDLEQAIEVLTALPCLEDLCLQGNPLNQALPASIQKLKSLRRIEFWDCHLTGTIPPELGSLEKLEYLVLMENPELTGPIPASLGNLSEASYINLSSCDLTGNIPVEITKLDKLEIPFTCQGNKRMSGTVPAEFSKWKYWNDYWGEIVNGTSLSLEAAPPMIPKFSVTLTDQSTVTADVVKDHKLTILFQWATWCGFSAQFLPIIRSAYKHFAKEGLYLLSWADPDEQYDKVLKHTEMNGIIWPIFLAGNENTVKSGLLPKYAYMNGCYPSSSYPSVNAFDSNGKLVYTNANSNQMETFVPFMQQWFDSDWDGSDESLYESTDYSLDGRMTILQAAKAGKGIDIVITGDAFSDRLIADGTFLGEAQRAAEAFFSVEPYKSMREFFNVYAVNAVSKTEVVHDETAFHTYWRGGNPNILGGDNNKVLQYARQAIGDARMDDAVIIVLMNLDMNAGTCHLFDCPGGDYGRGVTVSYIPTCSDERRYRELVVHEAGGHGFAKLADEYTVGLGTIPQEEAVIYRNAFAYGWWPNIDFTDDPTAVQWASFISDPRYASEGIGVFQGGATYDWGVYRPTANSVMNGGGVLNAPSRKAIWYRIMKLSQGAQWTGSYEDFVAWDLAHPTEPATKAARPNYVEKKYEPLAKPVIHNRSWREVIEK